MYRSLVKIAIASPIIVTPILVDKALRFISDDELYLPQDAISMGVLGGAIGGIRSALIPPVCYFETALITLGLECAGISIGSIIAFETNNCDIDHHHGVEVIGKTLMDAPYP